MVHYRCLICGEILRSNRPDVLLDHLRFEHPFVNVGLSRSSPRRCPPGCSLPEVKRYKCGTCAPQPCRPVPPSCPPVLRPVCGPCSACGPCPPQPCHPPPPCPPNPCPVPCAVNCPPPTQQDYCKAIKEQNRRERRAKYKCTVESWQPGSSKVVCPCCNCENVPVIRRQKNRIASSSLGACLMLGCWPFSCLPFLFNEGTTVNLYCANCDGFLGTYNRRMGCVTDIEGNFCNPGITPNFPSIP